MEDFTVAGTAPTYNTADFQQTMPTAAGALPLRATKLDERGKKLVSLSADFQSTVAAHNAKYNVSGDAFMEAQPPKAGGAPPPQATETTEWPAGRAVENPAEVVADGEALLELPTSQPDLANVLIDCKGQLWIKGQTDGVALPTLSLGQIHGRFLTGDEITQGREKKIDMRPWQMRSADYKA